MITYDDFKKVELKTARITAAERVEGSEKLLKLVVSLGNEERQIVAGIGKQYAPEDIIGKTIIIVANLEPRKFTLQSDSGQVELESRGMLLAASSESEGPVLLTVMNDIEPGSEIR